MNVLVESRGVFHWLWQVLGQCLRVTRWTSATVIVYSVVGRATRMLAFLLPLKVILLAGSDGVPRYFRPFLAPEHKTIGVVVLSITAILCYIATLYLEGRSKRLSERGSDVLLTISAGMSVVDNQRVQAQGHYARLMQCAANLLFALGGLVILGLLSPALGVWLIGLLSGFYLMTALALRKVGPLNRTAFSDLITERLGSYLGILSSVAFLSSFLVILYPFVVGADANILVAMICVMLLRQMLAALTGCIKDAVSLAGQRRLIDTLVFPDRQFQIAESKVQRTMRDLFGRTDRQATITEGLAEFVQPGERVVVKWRDPSARGLAEFDITIEGGEGPARYLRQIVLPPRLNRRLENENLLFRHIEREAVCAAPVVKRFSHGDHQCIVYDAGTGRAPAASRQAAFQTAFTVQLWSLELPSELVDVYRRLHRILPERLSDDLVLRMDIAADSQTEIEALESFRAALPRIQDVLSLLPLRLANPGGLLAGQLVQRSDGGINVLNWSNWSIEPIGASLPRTKLRAVDIEGLLAPLREQAPHMNDALMTVPHLRLAARGTLLEQMIQRGAMKAALKVAAQMLGDMESIGAASQPAITSATNSEPKPILHAD